MPHVVTMPGNSRYLSLYGWTGDKAAALQFRTKEDAQEHARSAGIIGALSEFVPEPTPPGVDPNGAAGIFGYRVPARG